MVLPFEITVQNVLNNMSGLLAVVDTEQNSELCLAYSHNSLSGGLSGDAFSFWSCIGSGTLSTE